MGLLPDLNDKETADHIRAQVDAPRGAFGWVTDGCGYRQHVRFALHRNAHFEGYEGDFRQFVLEYADSLDPSGPSSTASPTSPQSDKPPGEPSTPAGSGGVEGT